MLSFNLDECLFYIYDENIDDDITIDKESVLTYLDYPINFHGEVAKNFTLRKFRGMLNNYPYLQLPYISFKDFLRITQNIGFKIVNEEGFEKIIIGKTYNIRKSELTLLEQNIVEDEKVSTLNGFKITKARFVRVYENYPDIDVRVDCYARGKINNDSESYSLSTEKIIDIYDLPIEIEKDRYIEYQDKADKEKNEIISHNKTEDRYLSGTSLTLKEILDAIDMDIEFWDDEVIEELNTTIREESKEIEKYIALDKENKEKLNGYNKD